MIDFGFDQIHANHSLFILNQQNSCTAVLVYVDDLVITRDNIDVINSVKAHLHSIFKIKDLGPLKYFLGSKIARSEKGLYLHQRKYTMDILKDAGLENARPSIIPIDTPL